MNLTKKHQPPQPGKVAEDEMIQEIIMEGNKVVNKLPLMDGQYTVVVLNNKPRNYLEWLEWWYSIIDEASLETGATRYQLHALAKEHLKVASTKDIVEWEVAIHKLKMWLLTSIIN